VPKMVERLPPKAAFRTALRRVAQELSRLGIETMSPPTAMTMGPGLPELRFVCFRGPDHEVIELIEQPQTT